MRNLRKPKRYNPMKKVGQYAFEVASDRDEALHPLDSGYIAKSAADAMEDIAKLRRKYPQSRVRVIKLK